MPVNEKIGLRWNTNFESSVSKAFGELRARSELFDVTLGCSDSLGRTLQAHKVILSACSLFFKDILCNQANHDANSKIFIYFKGLSFSDLSAVLDFMYDRKVAVAKEDLKSFLHATEELKINGLTRQDIDKSPNNSSTYNEEESIGKPNVTSHKITKKKRRRNVHSSLAIKYEADAPLNTGWRTYDDAKDPDDEISNNKNTPVTHISDKVSDKNGDSLYMDRPPIRSQNQSTTSQFTFENTSFTCNTCGYYSDNEERLTQHVRKHSTYHNTQDKPSSKKYLPGGKNFAMLQRMRETQINPLNEQVNDDELSNQNTIDTLADNSGNKIDKYDMIKRNRSSLNQDVNVTNDRFGNPENLLSSGVKTISKPLRKITKSHKPPKSSNNKSFNVIWPPMKGSMIATLYEDNFYIGKVQSNKSKNNTVKVFYMERFKNSSNEKFLLSHKYWVWPTDKTPYKTYRETVIGTGLHVSLVEGIGNNNDHVYLLRSYEEIADLASQCKDEIQTKKTKTNHGEF